MKKYLRVLLALALVAVVAVCMTGCSIAESGNSAGGGNGGSGSGSNKSSYDKTDIKFDDDIPDGAIDAVRGFCSAALSGNQTKAMEYYVGSGLKSEATEKFVRYIYYTFDNIEYSADYDLVYAAASELELSDYLLNIYKSDMNDRYFKISDAKEYDDGVYSFEVASSNGGDSFWNTYVADGITFGDLDICTDRARDYIRSVFFECREPGRSKLKVFIEVCEKVMEDAEEMNSIREGDESNNKTTVYAVMEDGEWKVTADRDDLERNDDYIDYDSFGYYSYYDDEYYRYDDYYYDYNDRYYYS